jgi:hypothetical protein
MSHFPPKGQVLLVSDGSIGNGVYTPAATSNPLYVSGTTRVRFFVRVVTIAASALTNVTVKLQQRYSETQPKPFQLGWVDVPSSEDDAATPNLPTRKVEHTYAVQSGGAFDFEFVLEDPAGRPEQQVMVKANAVAQPGESVAVYAVAAGCQ